MEEFYEFPAYIYVSQEKSEILSDLPYNHITLNEICRESGFHCVLWLDLFLMIGCGYEVILLASCVQAASRYLL